MARLELVLPDGEVPRTVFYDRLLAAAARHPWAQADGPLAIAIPAEDTALETNWPRYGDGGSCFLRGELQALTPETALGRYVGKLCAWALAHPDARLLVFSKHPSLRLAAGLRDFPNIVLADGSLAAFERSLNPRTISFPSLPMVAARPAEGPRPILASFQGVDSHPLRRRLAELHNGRDMVVRLIEPGRHSGRIDAEAGRTDADYEGLIDASTFSFVPRGDSLFSYRLLEVMARGSIPVILSDGWVLPFDRTLDWPAFSVSVHAEAIGILPQILRLFSPADIARMQARLAEVYVASFADLDRILEATLREAAALS